MSVLPAGGVRWLSVAVGENVELRWKTLVPNKPSPSSHITPAAWNGAVNTLQTEIVSSTDTGDKSLNGDREAMGKLWIRNRES